MFENFHFIRPLWLLALLPLALLAWRGFLFQQGDNAWRNVVDARLMPLLQVGQSGKASQQALWLLTTAWLIATLALAGPTWERRPQPVFQTSAARVVVLDLSTSMNTADLAPSRLVRARYKIEDVLAQASEGQTGLVVYAGDAFTVSPLTRDANTIRSLLKVLEPGLMPAPGDRADLGLAKAGELLRQAGLTSGQVLLIADGVDPERISATERAAAKLRSEGYTVSVLGIGTEAGAPMAGAQGALERDAAGKAVLSRFDTTSLRSVARSGGGHYRTLTDDGQALQALLAASTSAQTQGYVLASAAPATWKEQGPWLVLFLLPLAALAFRRNWLVGLSLAGALAVSSPAADAATWRDAWQRPDQQAAHALAAGDYAEAAQAAANSADPALKGSAAYKLGDYQHALDNFSRTAGPEADYNRGNALARLGRLQEAVAAYDKSLAERSLNDDARANKAAVEALLKQQQQKQAQKQSGAGDKKPPDAQQGQGKDNGSGKDTAKGDDKGQGQDPKTASGTSGAGKQGQSEPSKGQPGSAQANQAATPSQQDKAASAKGSQGEKSSPQAGQPGQGGAPQPAPPSAAASGNDFAQAVKKLASADHKEPGGADPTAGGTPAAGQTDPAHQGRPGSGPGGPRAGSPAASSQAQPLQTEERLAAEQWLRRIPDDPGGLLRRKFLYQYRQRQQGASDGQ
jgi:Ca-activated chloride channel family protein